MPDNGSGGSDADWFKWIKNGFSSVAHPVGTCAMMSRDLSGVVDGRLRVYGIKNVRVVDASALPTQISAHLSATLYGFAEKVSILLYTLSFSGARLMHTGITGGRYYQVEPLRALFCAGFHAPRFRPKYD